MFQARFALAAVLASALTAHGADLTTGTPDIKSAGPLAFGPDGLLFVGDTQGAAIFAVDTADKAGDSIGGTIKIDGINEKIAALLGTEAGQVVINDMAVNPASGKVYLSVARGRGPTAAPVIVRAERSGKLEVVSMEKVPFAKATLTSVPAATPAPASPAGDTPPPAAKKKGMGGMGGSPRSQSITDMAYVDGKVYVAGLSNEEFASRFLAIPYPFTTVDKGTSVEIYHGAPRRARDQVADPDLRPVQDQRRAVPDGRLHLHPRWSRCPSPPSSRARTSRGPPSPSWATATSRSTWSSTRRGARITSCSPTAAGG